MFFARLVFLRLVLDRVIICCDVLYLKELEVSRQKPQVIKVKQQLKHHIDKMEAVRKASNAAKKAMEQNQTKMREVGAFKTSIYN